MSDPSVLRRPLLRSKRVRQLEDQRWWRDHSMPVVDPAIRSTLLAAMGSADALVAATRPFVHKDVIVARAVAQEAGASLGSLESVTDVVLERASDAH